MFYHIARTCNPSQTSGLHWHAKPSVLSALDLPVGITFLIT